MAYNDILSSYQEKLLAEDGFLLRRITPSYYYAEEIREKLITERSILFIKQGEMQIKLRGLVHTLTTNCMVDVLEDSLPFTILNTSSDIQAYHLIFSKDFLLNLFRNNPPFPPSYLISMRINPVINIKEDYAHMLLRHLEEIEVFAENPHHRFRDEILQSKVKIFILETANFLLQEREEDNTKDTNRRKILFVRFVKLVHEKAEKEHLVSYYATELCVTTQYLGRVVQEFSGKSVHQWICEILIQHIIQLLMDTDMTIQQIANKLNFSEQAVLTKMFKRYQGVSPLKYKKQYRK